MPEVTYMQVDARHDHSFRVPRPDLSVTHGTPNTCSACHVDEGAAWAAGVLRERNRLPAAGHWVDRLVAARARPWDARDELLGLATDALSPGIVRATAIVGLSLSGNDATTVLIGERARSSDPMLRWAVARSLQNSHPAVAADLGPTLLTDPVRAVRIAAAAALAPLGLELLPPEVVPDLERAIEEYLAAQRASAERPEAHINIGNMQRSRNRLEAAEASYRAALRQNPYFVPAYVNLSDLYRLQGRDPEGEAVLRTGLERLPRQPALHHALGLALVRQGQLPQAIGELKLAADASDAEPRFTLAYALALDAQGQSAEAAAYLENALVRFGEYPVLVGTLINIYQRMGDDAAAAALAGRMQNR
jgi:Flp pilus assembly protein TadD